MTNLAENPIVAVIDGCRHTSRHFDRDEITFLSSSALVEYKGVGKCCEDCIKEGKEPSSIGISGHGYFCAAIVASPEFHDARCEKLRSNKAAPHLAIYAVGCPACTIISEHDVAKAIQLAGAAKVNVISVSLMRDIPSLFLDEEPYARNKREDAILKVTVNGTLVVISGGNYGNHGLATISKSPPCCLTVASCTSIKKFRTTIDFVSYAAVELHPLQGHSMSMVQTPSELPVRKKGNIKNILCVMYINQLEEGSEIVIEASQEIVTTDPMSLVHISRETSTIISSYLDAVAENGFLFASFESSPMIDTDWPSVSRFSGRGPCSHFKDFMKPDICAPGENIIAAWPLDMPLEGGDHAKPDIARYAVGTGTSFSTPDVAAGVALIMAANKFSVFATISAAITTADKMHGKNDLAYEYAYGAGVFNLEKAMRPGLVYEEVAEKFWDFSYGAGISHSVLNLPYFSATFPFNSEEKWDCLFPRTLKSVEKGRSTYTADVVVRATNLSMSPQSIEINVEPKKLVFEDLNDEKNFWLNVHLPHTKTKNFYGIISGYLTWTKVADSSDDVKIVVDSPIILASKDMRYLLIDSQLS